MVVPVLHHDAGRSDVFDGGLTKIHQRDIGLIEDVDLYVRLAIAGWEFALCPSPEPLFAYRRHHSGSLSTGSQLAFSDGVVRNASTVESWAREHSVLDVPLTERIVDCYFQAARGFAGHDWQRFDAVVARIKGLADPVIPPGPRMLAILSSLIGYRAAERVAASWRTLSMVPFSLSRFMTSPRRECCGTASPGFPRSPEFRRRFALR